MHSATRISQNQGILIRHSTIVILCLKAKSLFRDQIIREVKKEEENLLSAQLNGQRSSSAISSQVSNGPLFNYDRKTDPKIIEEKQREILKVTSLLLFK